jgi:hypothetical protein
MLRLPSILTLYADKTTQQRFPSTGDEIAWYDDSGYKSWFISRVLVELRQYLDLTKECAYSFNTLHFSVIRTNASLRNRARS